MRLSVLPVLVAASVCGAAHADEMRRHGLQVSATTSDVTVLPRAAPRNPLRLPTLEYVFALRIHCVEPFQPSSVSLAIADTRRTLTADDLHDDGAAEVSLTVPANQLAPVPLENFCVELPIEAADLAPTPAGDGESVTLPATLSAQASLLCVSGSKQEITYTATPLDVTLTCQREDDSPD